MSKSWIKLFWLLLFVIIIFSIYIPWKLTILISSVIVTIIILFSVHEKFLSKKIWLKFDELIMKSNNIDHTLLKLYNKNKYKKYVYEYKANQKYITENDDEIIIDDKNNKFLIKVTKNWIEHKDFFKQEKLKYKNILNIQDSFILAWKLKISWISINLKDSKYWKKSKVFSSIFFWKKVFIPWENWKSLPIRKKFLIYKINKFIEKNKIKLGA